MATKKTATSVKKSSAKKALPTKTTKTNVTTVKAVSATKPAGRLSGFRLSRAPLLGAGVAEFIGAFLLAGAVLAGQGQPIIVLFALVGIVLAVGAISGAHVNPAITIGAWATRKITGLRALVYVVAQVLGAMLALVILGLFVDNAPAVSEQAAMYGQTAPELFKVAALPENKELLVLLAEVVGVTILSFAVASAWRQKDSITTAFTIGLGLFLALLITSYAASVIGASAVLNPAVAVAVNAIDFKSVWPLAVYVFGAVLGGILGFLLSDVLQNENNSVRDVR